MFMLTILHTLSTLALFLHHVQVTSAAPIIPIVPEAILSPASSYIEITRQLTNSAGSEVNMFANAMQNGDILDDPIAGVRLAVAGGLHAAAFEQLMKGNTLPASVLLRVKQYVDALYSSAATTINQYNPYAALNVQAASADAKNKAAGKYGSLQHQ